MVRGFSEPTRRRKWVEQKRNGISEAAVMYSLSLARRVWVHVPKLPRCVIGAHLQVQVGNVEDAALGNERRQPLH